MVFFGKDQTVPSESTVEKFLRIFHAIPKPFPKIIFGVEYMHCYVLYYVVSVKYMNISL